MARVQLKRVWKRYGEVVAVREAEIDIADREFVVLVGPSGCGKSTTLRMVAGLEEISEGEILIGDRVVNNVHPKDRDIAMVFQSYALYPHMNVYDNLAFGLKMRKTPKDEIDRRVRKAAETLGLTEFLKRKPKQLSGGQRQRVAMGRAIVRDPAVFLFDEPLSNLDAKLRVQMRTEIAKLHRKLGTTIIYVTHDQVEAMTLAEKIVVMKDGIIQQIGAPLEVYNNPRNVFVAGFIGSPAMNFLTGRLENNNGALRVSGEGFSLPLAPEMTDRLKESALESQDVVIGIRPHQMALPSGPALKARLEVVEPMGAEIYCYFDLAGTQIIARMNHTPGEIGEEIELCVAPDKIHLFDPETEKSLFK